MKNYEDHYRKYLSAYKSLSHANNGKTIWIPTDKHDGWYVNELVQDESSEAWDEGYTHKSRPSVLPDDLSPDVERTAYTTISYAEDSAYKTCYFRKENGDIEWMNNNSDRLPDYGELSAWALFVDIDIGKEYKKRPLPKDHKDVLKSRLSLWVQAFSEMSGDIEHVYVLDSGGGIYVFIPPCALSPISDRYDEEELNLVFNEIGERMRKITGNLDDLICNQDSAPKELFSADKVQNKNRQYKTIGSIHKSLDSVVYPIDATSIHIEHKPVESIDKEDVQKAESWAESFTSNEHRDCVGSIIKYMFQGDFTERDDINIKKIEGSDWRDILDNWLEQKRESIQAWKSSIQNREQIEQDKLKTDITQDRDVAREAIRRVNNNKLKDYIHEFLGSEHIYPKSGEEFDFFPFWRGQSTESGRSAFYDFYEGKARFTDKADGKSRDIVYWVALEMTYSDQYNEELISSPGDDLSSNGYRKALDELRARGEPIPILVPDIDEDEKLSDWRIRNLALKLDIADKADIIVDAEGNKTTKPKAWNRTIDRLYAEGIKHNRNKKEPLTKDDIKPPTNPEIESQVNSQQRYNRFFDSLGYYLDDFESKEKYIKFIQNHPNHVIPFVYDGEIMGSEVNSVVAGTFVEQDDDSILLTRYVPFPKDTIEHIDSYTEIEIKADEFLDKSNMKILVKP